MKKTSLLLAMLLMLAVSCKKNDNQYKHLPNDPVVAKVYGNYLYMSEIEKAIPDGLSVNDSAVAAQNYINNWIEEKMMANVAQQYLSDEKIKQIDQKVEDFRNSLLIHSFKQELIKQKLDTNVSLDLISQYYETHKQDFILDQPAIRGYYFSVPLDAPDLPEIRTLAFSGEEDINALKQLVIKSGGKFVDFTTQWKLFRDVMTNIPFVVSDPDFFVKTRKYLQTQDDYNYYYLKILEYRQTGDFIPLPLCQDKIKKIILNRRSQQLLKAIEKNLYDKAVSKGDIKIYQ